MNVYWPNFHKRGGLITVVVQDATSKEVLMVASTDEAGLLETLRTGEAVYFSTSRNQRWKKGETSGDIQTVSDVLIDCDGDAVVYLVEQRGDGACHTKARSDFFRRSPGAVWLMDAPLYDEGRDGLEVRDADVCDRLSRDCSSPRSDGSCPTMRPTPGGSSAMKSEKLRFVLPNGSLWERLVMFLSLAGFSISKPDRTGFCGTVNGVEFFQFDRRMVPQFVATSCRCDAGITGKDLLLASGVEELREIAPLCFSRASDQPTRWVLAKRKERVLQQGDEVVIGCELPELARKILDPVPLPFTYRIVKIEGSEEPCVLWNIVDMVLVVTETGGSLRACGLEIVQGCDCLLESTPVILARRYLPPEKEETLQRLSLALQAVIGTQQYVMVAFDIPSDVDLERLPLPASVAPTVSPSTDKNWNVCEICLPRPQFGAILLLLKKVGAKGIVMRNIEGYLP
ncbi:MAG: phosphoribosyl-AMP cyclohydrolase [Candidatus Peribacteraceae bacterium]|nr:phosphoribosyl-AMP cyclohydrolase [Candidatus Peribacteraceae bacterium]